MATASGLIFTAAALDPHLPAFDTDTGKELRSVELPASAQATVMTYAWNAKQYVVICSGGHGKMKSKWGLSDCLFHRRPITRLSCRPVFRHGPQ
jgi:quinoprotein glucose dehydrogenase